MGDPSNPNAEPMWKSNFEAYSALINFPQGCDGLYDQLNVTSSLFTEGNYISYLADWGGRVPPKPLIGNFIGTDINKMVLKFEVYVPAQYPINGAHANIYLPPKGTNGSYAYGRDLTNMKGDACTPGAFWQPFEATINKTDPDNWVAETGNRCKTPFYTDGWMTVSVPLSTFKWNISARGIYSDMAKNFGDYPGSSALADVTQLDPTKDMGDFTFEFEPYDMNQSGIFFMFIDNFRIVPDDGGGVQFDKIGKITNLKEGTPADTSKTLSSASILFILLQASAKFGIFAKSDCKLIFQKLIRKRCIQRMR